MVTIKVRKWQYFSYLKGLLIILAMFTLAISIKSCGRNDISTKTNLLKIGHSGGNLPVALYEAQKSESFNEKYESKRLESNSTVVYALMSGNLDIGFIEAEKIKSMSKLEGFENLRAVGKVTYPYGATLILRKGLTNKITELNGLNIAISSPNCKLLKAFSDDAKRLNADISGVNYINLEFDAMLPALEAKKVDGVIIKGFYSALALKEGHSVLYQNWEVTPGDDCCPAIIDQAALIMVTNEKTYDQGKELAKILQKSQDINEDDLRRTISQNTTIPYDVLTGQPVAKFLADNNNIINIFLEAEDHEGDDH